MFCFVCFDGGAGLGGGVVCCCFWGELFVFGFVCFPAFSPVALLMSTSKIDVIRNVHILLLLSQFSADDCHNNEMNLGHNESG